MKRVEGFTLIELMIVVLIIALLAGLAFSAYNKQVRKSRRAEAKQALSDVMLRQEKWRSNHGLYIGTDSGADLTIFGVLPTTSSYVITLTSTVSATGYSMQAAAPSGTDQAKDSCGTLSITNTAGVITKSPTTAGCW